MSSGGLFEEEVVGILAIALPLSVDEIRAVRWPRLWRDAASMIRQQKQVIVVIALLN